MLRPQSGGQAQQRIQESQQFEDAQKDDISQVTELNSLIISRQFLDEPQAKKRNKINLILNLCLLGMMLLAYLIAPSSYLEAMFSTSPSAGLVYYNPIAAIIDFLKDVTDLSAITNNLLELVLLGLVITQVVKRFRNKVSCNIYKSIMFSMVVFVISLTILLYEGILYNEVGTYLEIINELEWYIVYVFIALALAPLIVDFYFAYSLRNINKGDDNQKKDFDKITSIAINALLLVCVCVLFSRKVDSSTFVFFNDDVIFLAEYSLFYIVFISLFLIALFFVIVNITYIFVSKEYIITYNQAKIILVITLLSLLYIFICYFMGFISNLNELLLDGIVLSNSQSINYFECLSINLGYAIVLTFCVLAEIILYRVNKKHH